MRFVVTVLAKKKLPAPFAHIILSASPGIIDRKMDFSLPKTVFLF
jgi:hypothetical protein